MHACLHPAQAPPLCYSVDEPAQPLNALTPPQQALTQSLPGVHIDSSVLFKQVDDQCAD